MLVTLPVELLLLIVSYLERDGTTLRILSREIKEKLESYKYPEFFFKSCPLIMITGAVPVVGTRADFYPPHQQCCLYHVPTSTFLEWSMKGYLDTWTSETGGDCFHSKGKENILFTLFDMPIRKGKEVSFIMKRHIPVTNNSSSTTFDRYTVDNNIYERMRRYFGQVKKSTPRKRYVSRVIYFPRSRCSASPTFEESVGSRSQPSIACARLDIDHAAVDPSSMGVYRDTSLFERIISNIEREAVFHQIDHDNESLRIEANLRIAIRKVGVDVESLST